MPMLGPAPVPECSGADECRNADAGGNDLDADTQLCLKVQYQTSFLAILFIIDISFQFKGTVQPEQRWVETGINQLVLPSYSITDVYIKEGKTRQQHVKQREYFCKNKFIHLRQETVTRDERLVINKKKRETADDRREQKTRDYTVQRQVKRDKRQEMIDKRRETGIGRREMDMDN